MTSQPGSVWREKNSTPNERRLVEVDTAEDGGFVEGVGWWQVHEHENERWQDLPDTSRRTRIRTHMFLRRFEEITHEQY